METKQRLDLLDVPAANLVPIQAGHEAQLHSGIAFQPSQNPTEIVFRAPTFWRSGELRAAGFLALQTTADTPCYVSREMQASIPSGLSHWLSTHVLHKKDMAHCVLLESRPMSIRERFPAPRRASMD